MPLGERARKIHELNSVIDSSNINHATPLGSSNSSPRRVLSRNRCMCQKNNLLKCLGHLKIFRAS